MPRVTTDDPEPHPMSICGFCEADLGVEEGFVMLVGGKILTFCERDECREKADELDERDYVKHRRLA